MVSGGRFFFFKQLNLFLIEGQLLYSIVLVSAKHQHESAIGIPMSPPSCTGGRYFNQRVLVTFFN